MARPSRFTQPGTSGPGWFTAVNQEDTRARRNPNAPLRAAGTETDRGGPVGRGSVGAARREDTAAQSINGDARNHPRSRLLRRTQSLATLPRPRGTIRTAHFGSANQPCGSRSNASIEAVWSIRIATSLKPPWEANRIPECKGRQSATVPSRPTTQPQERTDVYRGKPNVATRVPSFGEWS